MKSSVLPPVYNKYFWSFWELKVKKNLKLFGLVNEKGLIHETSRQASVLALWKNLEHRYLGEYHSLHR